MKVLITTPTYPPYNSGLGNAVQRQAALLAASGCSVVIATSGLRRDHRFDAESGAMVEEFNVHGSRFPANPIHGDVESYVRFLLESEFDVVLMNAWQIWSTDICLEHLKRIHGKKVLYSHCLSTNLFFWDRPFKSAARWLLWRPYHLSVRKALKHLDAMIALAPSGRGSRFDDIRMAKSAATPVYVVPNVLSPEAIHALEGPKKTFEQRNQIISVGSFDWRKDHNFVLRSYALSRAKNDIPLRIFGQQFNAYSEKLIALSRELGIDSSFLSLHEGIVGKELIDEYQKSLLFISGSRTECQPLVILDALATGTPYVSRSSGCIKRLWSGHDAVSERLAAASLDRLIEDRDEWSRQSEAGISEASSRYHHRNVGKELVTVLRTITGR